jgi:DNA-binding NarL/FixJ family response regulator
MPEDLLNIKHKPKFTHIIFKLTNVAKIEKFIPQIKETFAGVRLIGLSTEIELKLNIKLSRYFDFIYHDSVIENKLNSYFHLILNKNPESTTPTQLQIENHNSIYINLPENLSETLYLIYKGDTAGEIGSKLSKSERTVEKYFIALKKLFQVNTKKELAAIYGQISGLGPNKPD